MTNETEKTENEQDQGGLIDPVVMPSFEFWAVFCDGELEEEMCGIGVINGLHGSQLDQIHEELKDHILEMEDDFPANCSVDFSAKNVSYEAGQMTFPETGQWDFPPHYEMDISVVKVEEHGKEA